MASEKAKRKFGLGFGSYHQVIVYTEGGPKTGALLTDEHCTAIAKWKADSTDTSSIIQFIPPAALAKALENRLLHLDTVELVRLLPKLLQHMSPQDRAKIFVDPVVGIPTEMWEEIGQTRPHLKAELTRPAVYFGQLANSNNSIALTQHQSYDDILFNNVSMEATATLLPILFASLQGEQRFAATQAIAEALHASGEDKPFFGPLENPDLNRLVITDTAFDACTDITNNGRTIMVRSKNGQRVAFQGDEYISNDIHFHPLKNVDGNAPLNDAGEQDNKPEFKCYKTAVAEMQFRKNKYMDPNRKMVGQLHSIYVTPDGKRALLLGANVVLGKANSELEKYLTKLRNHLGGQRVLPRIENIEDSPEVFAKSIPAGDVSFNPLACFDKPFNVDGIPEAPFMSLHLGGLKVKSVDAPELMDDGNHAFYRGVRVIYLPEPITISQEQLQTLRELQPTLKVLDENKCVHPRARYQPAQRWREVARSEVSQPRTAEM